MIMSLTSINVLHALTEHEEIAPGDVNLFLTVKDIDRAFGMLKQKKVNRYINKSMFSEQYFVDIFNYSFNTRLTSDEIEMAINFVNKQVTFITKDGTHACLLVELKNIPIINEQTFSSTLKLLFKDIKNIKYKTHVYRGNNYYNLYKLDTNSSMLYFALLDKTIALSSTEPFLKEIIDNVKLSNQPVLNRNPMFRKSINSLEEKSFIYGYAKNIKDEKPSTKQKKSPFEMLFSGNLNIHYAFSIRNFRKGFLLETVSTFEGTKPLFLDAFKMKDDKLMFHKMIPDSCIIGGTIFFDIKEIYYSLRKIMSNQFPKEEQQILGYLKQFETMFKINLEKDIIDTLGEEVGLVFFKGKANSSFEDFILMISLRNPERLNNAITKLLESPFFQAIKTKKRNYKGFDIYEYQYDGTMKKKDYPAFTIYKDFAVLSAKYSSLTVIIDTILGERKNIFQDKNYQDLLINFPGRKSNIARIDFSFTLGQWLFDKPVETKSSNNSSKVPVINEKYEKSFEKLNTNIFKAVSQYPYLYIITMEDGKSWHGYAYAP